MNTNQMIYVIASAKVMGATTDYINGLEKMASVAMQVPVSEVQMAVREMMGE